MRNLPFCLVVLVFACTGLASCTATASAAGASSENLAALKPYLRQSVERDFAALNRKIPVNIYFRDETTGDEPAEVIIYVMNRAWERIGTEDNLSILSDYIRKRFIVVTVDLGDDPRAVSTAIDWDVHLIYRALAGYRTPSIIRAIKLEPKDTRFFVLPEGYRVATDLTYWEIDKHGAYGTLEHIMKTYNEEIVPKAKGVKPAEKPSDMVGPDGGPLDYRVKMDIVYPSQPKKKLPVFVYSDTQWSRPPHHQYVFQLRGYAYVLMAHCFNPCEAYRHIRSFTLDHWNGLACYTAAMRYLNKYADKYGLDTSHIGMMGVSKGQYAVTRLSAPNHDAFTESRKFPGFPAGSPEPQPWQGYPSNIHAGWQGMGMGLWESEYITPDYAPTILACGEHDRDVITKEGNPKFLAALAKLDVNYVDLFMEGLGHGLSVGYDKRLGVDRYQLVNDFFDRYLKVEDKLPPVVLIATPHDGAEDVKPTDAIWVQFAPVIDEKTIVGGRGITVVDLTDGRELKGSWKTSRRGTMFTFVPDQPLEKGREYEVSVTRAVKDKAGTALEAVKKVRFKTAD